MSSAVIGASVHGYEAALKRTGSRWRPEFHLAFSSQACSRAEWGEHVTLTPLREIAPSVCETAIPFFHPR